MVCAGSSFETGSKPRSCGRAALGEQAEQKQKQKQTHINMNENQMSGNIGRKTKCNINIKSINQFIFDLPSPFCYNICCEHLLKQFFIFEKNL